MITIITIILFVGALFATYLTLKDEYNDRLYKDNNCPFCGDMLDHKEETCERCGI